MSKESKEKKSVKRLNVNMDEMSEDIVESVRCVHHLSSKSGAILFAINQYLQFDKKVKSVFDTRRRVK